MFIYKGAVRAKKKPIKGTAISVERRVLYPR